MIEVFLFIAIMMAVNYFLKSFIALRSSVAAKPLRKAESLFYGPHERGWGERRK